jgi:predicted unusual protein kinase regulating ubiquinone biosynthesis (AarF/ABC1/UbiB family)
MHKQHQVVLLDHGMYRRLDPDFRLTYCQLWKAFLTRDNKLGAQTAQVSATITRLFAVSYIYIYVKYLVCNEGLYHTVLRYILSILCTYEQYAYTHLC